jgi:hypothetical protein
VGVGSLVRSLKEEKEKRERRQEGREEISSYFEFLVMNCLYLPVLGR